MSQMNPQAAYQALIQQGMSPEEARRRVEALQAPGILSSQQPMAQGPMSPMAGAPDAPNAPQMSPMQLQPTRSEGASRPQSEGMGILSQAMAQQAPQAPMTAPQEAQGSTPPRRGRRGGQWSPERDPVTAGILSSVINPINDRLSQPATPTGQQGRGNRVPQGAMGQLEQLVQQYVQMGMPRDQAIARAQSEMGVGAPTSPRAPTRPMSGANASDVVADVGILSGASERQAQRQAQAPAQAPATEVTPMAEAIRTNPATAPAQAPKRIPASTLARRDTYMPLFTDAAARHGVPAALLEATGWAESAFNPKAVSHAGAQGLMQFMPKTAAGFNIDPNDPAQAVDGAARYYKKLLGMFGGDQDKAIAAYNWGEGNLQKAIKEHGDNWLAHAPEETQNHVRKINGYLAGDVGSAADRAAQGLPVGFEEVPPPALRQGAGATAQQGTPSQSGVESVGALSSTFQSQMGQQPVSAQQGAQMERPRKARETADEFYQRIYSNPFKAALYHGLAALAEVDPYKHLNLLRDMDAQEAEEALQYQKLTAPMSQADMFKLEQERLKTEQERFKTQQMMVPQGPKVKTSTFNPETGEQITVYEDGQIERMPVVDEGYIPPSQQALLKVEEESRRKQAELQRTAGNAYDATMAGLDDVQRMVDQGYDSGAFGPLTGNPAAGVVDKGLATIGSESAKERVKLRAEASQTVTQQTLALLQQLKGATTDHEWKVLEKSVPSASSTQAEYEAWLGMARRIAERAYRSQTGEAPSYGTPSTSGYGGQASRNAEPTGTLTVGAQYY